MAARPMHGPDLPAYSPDEPMRAEIDAMRGATLLEFGNAWCGWCRRAQPLIAQVLHGRANVRHIRIADASGKRLGRSFGVKLWPTFIFLKDGRELARAVRPADVGELAEGLARIL